MEMTVAWRFVSQRPWSTPLAGAMLSCGPPRSRQPQLPFWLKPFLFKPQLPTRKGTGWFISVRENGSRCHAVDGVTWRCPPAGCRFFGHVQNPCNGLQHRSAIRHTFRSHVVGGSAAERPAGSTPGKSRLGRAGRTCTSTTTRVRVGRFGRVKYCRSVHERVR